MFHAPIRRFQLQSKLELPVFSGFTIVPFNQLCSFLQAFHRSYIFCRSFQASKKLPILILTKCTFNTFKYHVSCTNGKISVRINFLFYLFFSIIPSSYPSGTQELILGIVINIIIENPISTHKRQDYMNSAYYVLILLSIYGFFKNYVSFLYSN